MIDSMASLEGRVPERTASTRGWQQTLLLPLQHGSLGLAGGAGWLLWRGWGDVRARPGHIQPPCAVRAASALGWREGTFVQDINNIHDQLVDK